MTAMSLPAKQSFENQRRPSFAPILILLAVVALAIAAGVILKDHAARHSMADKVRNCPDDRLGAIIINPITNRKAKVCEFEPGQWGRMIVEQTENSVEEVTSYADSARKTRNLIDRVMRNLLNQGYSRVEYMRPDVAEVVMQILSSP